MPCDSEQDLSCRLDVWLFRTRLIKTRSGAARLIAAGKVRLSRHGRTERVKKPHTLIRPGDGVSFMRGQHLMNLEMISPGTRRGPAPEARTLYREIDEADG